MHVILALLIAASASYFGAVQAPVYYAIAIAWAIATAVLLAARILKTRRLEFDSLILVACMLGLPFIVGLKSAVALYALPWAWVATRRSRSPRALFHILILFGSLEALLGLVQYFVSPGWMIFYVNTISITSGTLINRNHFAGLLEMLIPISFGLAYFNVRAQGEAARSYLYLLSGAFMGLALLFSLSRMGIGAFLVSITMICILVSTKESSRKLAMAMGGTLAGLVVVAGLWIGMDTVVSRYDKMLTEPNIAGGRTMVNQGTISLIRDHPRGIGAGNYRDYFRQYQTDDLELLYDHAHNDYLETSAEWGLPIAALFWFVVIFGAARALRAFLRTHDPMKAGVLVACLGSIAALLIHSFADFNLQIPSNAMLFSAIVGVALATSGGRRSSERQPREG